MPCSYRGNKQPLEDSVSCETAWQCQSPQKQPAKLFLLLQHLAGVYSWAAAPPEAASALSKSLFKSLFLFLNYFFLVNPTWCSPSAALTSPGSDNPPKADGLGFKALKSQSAGLNLPNSVPDGIKPSWAKLGVKLQIYSPALKEF